MLPPPALDRFSKEKDERALVIDSMAGGGGKIHSSCTTWRTFF
jgi:hypothetical protein